jgi:hypothetical protein
MEIGIREIGRMGSDLSMGFTNTLMEISTMASGTTT